jgi:hypothetical protein
MVQRGRWLLKSGIVALAWFPIANTLPENDWAVVNVLVCLRVQHVACCESLRGFKGA